MNPDDLIARAKLRRTFINEVATYPNIRKQAHVSQREIAKAMGVGVMTANRWELGKVIPTHEHLVAYMALMAELREIAS